MATNLDNRAAFYDAQGRYVEAELLHQRALAILERGLGPEHPDVAARLDILRRIRHRCQTVASTIRYRLITRQSCLFALRVSHTERASFSASYRPVWTR